MRLGKGRAKNGLLAKCFAHPNGFMICRELCLNKFLKLGPRKETPVPWLHASFLIGNLVHSHKRLWQKTVYLFWILRSSEILCGCFVSYEQDFPLLIASHVDPSPAENSAWRAFHRRWKHRQSISLPRTRLDVALIIRANAHYQWRGWKNLSQCEVILYIDIGIYTMFSGKEPTISTKSWVVKKWL